MNINSLSNNYKRVDHLAIAVKDLEQAKYFYQTILGFRLEEERVTEGEFSAMKSAVMAAPNFKIVLVQGTTPESQVSRFIETYGAGVQHIAFEVDDLYSTYEEAKAQGLEFATSIIEGIGLRQVFSVRDENSGMMFEFIERRKNEGFEDDSVNELFRQLEAKMVI